MVCVVVVVIVDGATRREVKETGGCDSNSVWKKGQRKQSMRKGMHEVHEYMHTYTYTHMKVCVRQ